MVGKKSFVSQIVPFLSSVVADVNPFTTEETVSQQVAKDNDTTVQGGHVLMLRGIIKKGNLSPRLLEIGVRKLILKEGRDAVLEFGTRGILEQLRWMPDDTPDNRFLRKQLVRLIRNPKDRAVELRRELARRREVLRQKRAEEVKKIIARRS